MPLIRYDTQDQARLAAVDEPCPCGRGLPAVQKVLGRCDDVVVTPDGRRLVQLDIVFDPAMAIREAQIIQESAACLRVKVVPAPGWSEANAQALQLALRDLVGPMEVVIEPVTEIAKTWAGKYRCIVSLLGTNPKTLSHEMTSPAGMAGPGDEPGSFGPQVAS